MEHMRATTRGVAILVVPSEAKRSREWGSGGSRDIDRRLPEREVSESNLWI
jgi:hypothetical protein